MLEFRTTEDKIFRNKYDLNEQSSSEGFKIRDRIFNDGKYSDFFQHMVIYTLRNG